MWDILDVEISRFCTPQHLLNQEVWIKWKSDFAHVKTSIYWGDRKIPKFLVIFTVCGQDFSNREWVERWIKWQVNIYVNYIMTQPKP